MPTMGRNVVRKGLATQRSSEAKGQRGYRPLGGFRL